jgi:hypothetical protein
MGETVNASCLVLCLILSPFLPSTTIQVVSQPPCVQVERRMSVCRIGETEEGWVSRRVAPEAYCVVKRHGEYMIRGYHNGGFGDVVKLR